MNFTFKKWTKKIKSPPQINIWEQRSRWKQSNTSEGKEDEGENSTRMKLEEDKQTNAVRYDDKQKTLEHRWQEKLNATKLTKLTVVKINILQKHKDYDSKCGLVCSNKMLYYFADLHDLTWSNQN